MSDPSSETARVRRATFVGATAVLMWSTLAALATFCARIPPLELLALSFGIAFALCALVWAVRGEDPRVHLRQPARAWLLGIGGLFGYHLLYFIALRLAPPVEANLLNYLWPLLIVVFSALLPGERLRSWHVAGAAAGLAGTALLVTGGGGLAVRAEHAPGYLAAAGCAVLWAGYSVLSRRLGAVPTDAVGGFCLATSLLALALHLLLERTVIPDATEATVLLVMGAGPVGGAFFAWDIGCKRGDLRALGALSYATPLLSTLLLVATGRPLSGGAVPVAALLITGGAALASRDLWARRA